MAGQGSPHVVQAQLNGLHDAIGMVIYSLGACPRINIGLQENRSKKAFGYDGEGPARAKATD
jgi:hypothetical protein